LVQSNNLKPQEMSMAADVHPVIGPRWSCPVVSSTRGVIEVAAAGAVALFAWRALRNRSIRLAMRR
jgi:hypothetical protein